MLSQLGGIRRASSNYSTTLAQIQQLQQQIGRRAGSRRIDGAVGGGRPPSSSQHPSSHANGQLAHISASAFDSAPADIRSGKMISELQ